MKTLEQLARDNGINLSEFLKKHPGDERFTKARLFHELSAGKGRGPSHVSGKPDGDFKEGGRWVRSRLKTRI